MNFLISHYGEPWQAVAATSLIKGLRAKHADCKISWATTSECFHLYQYNRNLEDVYVGPGSIKGGFDVAINLTPTMEAVKALDGTEASQKIGFVLSKGNVAPFVPENEDILEVLLGNRRTNKHILQMYYRLAGLRWRGEGYDFAYYPRNKMKKRKTGIAVSDPNLRSFVKDNLSLEYSEIWHVPLRTNLLKRIDEINRVKHLITDDLFSAHIGIATRKHVEFLDINNLNMSIEFFNKGHHHRIDNDSKSLPYN